MDYIRFDSDRGRANFGWLRSRHSFSFGSYYHPQHMGVSSLRVINDDRVAPGRGFGAHGHRDMEIISYVMEGQIEHKDSMGNHFVIPAGEVQRMSAGTGITHSEYNPSRTAELRFLQIWIQPKNLGVAPSYAQKKIIQSGPLTPLVTPDGANGSLSMNQDASMSRLALEAGGSLTLNVDKRRNGYLHVLSGSVGIETDTPGVNDATMLELGSGDGLGSVRSRALALTASTDFAALWFDLPA